MEMDLPASQHHTSLGFGRPLPSRSLITSNPISFAQSPLTSSVEDRRRELTAPLEGSDEDRGRASTRTVDLTSQVNLEREITPCTRGLQLLLETIAPVRLQDLVRGSVESNSLTAGQAEELVQAYNRSRDSAALLEVLDGAAIWQAGRGSDGSIRAPVEFKTAHASTSAESLARTEESSVASLSRFPWPPVPQPDPVSTTTTTTQAPHRSPPRNSRSRERIHHRAASSTTLGNYRGVFIQANESPLFRKVFHERKLETQFGRKSDVSSRASANSPTDELTGMAFVNCGGENNSVSSGKSIRSNTPSRVTFDDLPTAHSSITARSRSRPRQEVPIMTEPATDDRHDRPKPGRVKMPRLPIDVQRSEPDAAKMKQIAPFYDPDNVAPTQPTLSTTLASMELKPVAPSTWMGRLSNVFKGKVVDSPDDVESRGRVRHSATMPLAEHKRASGLRPNSQSTPHVFNATSHDEDGALSRWSSSEKAVSRHQHHTSSVYQNSLGGTPAGSIRASHLLDPDSLATHLVKSHIEYADDVHREIHQPTEGRSNDRHNGIANFDTVDLVSDADSDDEAASGGHKKVTRRRSGFSLFDFGLGRKSDGASSKASSQRPSDAGSHRSSMPVSSTFPGATVQHAHTASSNYDRQSQCSSYYGTRHTQSSFGRVPSLVPPESGAPTVPSRSSLRSASIPFEEKDVNGDDVGWVPFSFGHEKKRYEPSGRGNGEIATFRVARATAPSPQSELCVRNESGSTANGQGSGRSQQNGSIVVFNENGIDQDDERRRSYKDLGPGSLQSSSSQGFLSHRASTASDDSGHGGSDGASLHDTADMTKTMTTSRRGAVTAKGNYSVSVASTKPSRSASEQAILDDLEAEDDEGDWETIGGSGLPSRGNTRATLANATTGSSLADYPGHLGKSPKGRSYSPLRYGQAYPMHPADERYEHVYRVRESVPDGVPVLLPSYNYQGGSGSGFPHRNAMTPPYLMPRSTSARYQHPAPLSKDHRHPFQSSPPTVDGSGLRPLPRALTIIDTLKPKAKPKAKPADRKATIQFETPHADEAVEYSTNVKHSHRNVSSVSSIEYNDPQGSFHSLYLTENQEESSFACAGVEVDLPSPNGSFAKVTFLGPHANVTGTPEGTGMRLVGSSLADRSSPGIQWSSSPGHHLHTPTELERIDSLSQRYTPMSSPPQAHLSPNDGSSHGRKPGVLYEQIRAHRELLSAEGLLPRSFTPPAAQSASSAAAAAARRARSLFSQDGSVMNHYSAGRLVAPAMPFAVNVTEPLPPPTDPEKLVGFDYRLHRLPRDSSEASSMRLRRKITLSRVILALCLLFPPLLLLYGYGMLDVVISSITDGKVTRLHQREKRLALYIGWGLAAGAVVGIVIGMIIIGVGVGL